MLCHQAQEESIGHLSITQNWTQNFPSSLVNI
jgi:hypothetical protein